MQSLILTGGVGDLLLSLPLVACLEKECGPFDIYTPNPEAYLSFTGKPARRIAAGDAPPWRDHACAIEISNLARFTRCADDGPHVPVAIRNKAFIERNGFIEICRRHPFLDGQSSARAKEMGLDRRTLAGAMLGYSKSELEAERAVLFSEASVLSPSFGTYVTLHAGVGLNHAGNVTRSTKSWDVGHFSDLIHRLREARPDIKTIQLGASETSQKIPGVDLCLFGLSLDQSIAVLSQSQLHIDGESGLVHIANRLGVRSVVMFGPTPLDYFSYDANINLSAKMPCSPCWWSTDTWVAQCPKGYKTPTCMNMIFPERVLASVLDALKTVPSSEPER